MNTATIPSSTQTRRALRQTSARPDLALLAGVAVAVAAAWWIARAGHLRAGDDLGYTIGLVGGLLMLALMLYPVRKYLGVLRHAGPLKAWFWMHMVCGLLGPWLILVHSTFRIGSLNAGVALLSMVVVVASGLVGRYLFVRVQHRLDGGQAALQTLRDTLGLASDEARSQFAFAPEVLADLRLFEQTSAQAPGAAPLSLLQVLIVPWRRWRTQRRCLAALDARLAQQARLESWSPAVRRRRRNRARALLRRYFDAVLRVAHYTLFDRLFALWHVAHLPFVVLLALSAIVHVVAVHAY